MKELRFYRANKNNTGVASAWQISKKDDKYNPYMMFLKVAKQTGMDDKDNATYDWDGGLTVKLGENDLGEILAVINGRQQTAGYNGSLFHQSAKGNKVIKFAYDDEKKNYFLQVTHQNEDKTKVGPFSQGLNEGEIQLLKIFLEEGFKFVYFSQ